MPGAQEALRQIKTETPNPIPSNDNNQVLKAKEAADIAESELKRLTAEHKRKLLEQGYQTLEDALVDVDKKKEEANRILELVKQQEASINKKLTDIDQEQQKLANLAQIISQKEVMVKSRLEKTIEIEQESEARNDAQVALKDELQKLIDYHKENIKPCRKALYDVAVCIYNWADELVRSKTDYIELYNYLLSSFNIIDRYLEKTNTKPKKQG